MRTGNNRMKNLIIFLILIPLINIIVGFSSSELNSAKNFFYCDAQDYSTCDSVILLAHCKVFFTPYVSKNAHYIKIYNFDILKIDSAIVKSKFAYNKKKKCGYILNTIGDSIVIDKFEIKKFAVSGWYEAYNQETTNLIQFKMRYKKGKLHGHYFMYGTAGRYKNKLIVHKIFRKGKEKRIILDIQ